MVVNTNNNLVQNTTHKVVIPFYVYAGLSFLTATVLLFLSDNAFTQHYFQPRTLAITHTMALGWGTMIILGASHQLVPVLIEAKLFSNALAYASFVLAAIGIPLLIYSFFQFQFNGIAQAGAVLINAAVVCFVLNLAASILKSKNKNVHAVFVFTASVWLLATTVMGFLLVFNFTKNILPKDSVRYLSLHAHIGLVGWFLLLVMGVGSRLIPMFLISKYDDAKTLWLIYFLVNGALISFIVLFFSAVDSFFYTVPLTAVLLALLLFANYCREAYKQRIRKQVDKQVKISLLSVAMMLLPLIFLAALIALLLFSFANTKLVLAYGFSVFFGWLTAIILGMTFKTLPFIVWNKVYHNRAGLGKTPNPKDLFSESLFQKMGLAYLAGFGLFTAGILLGNTIVLQIASVLLFITAALYNVNILKMLRHKPLIK
ncbi:cytochrome C oxidase subunit I [Flavisolibacter ginsenosidimutans]|uniref:Cytochrome C oxidase subunit I n=1 Tax=Flavisolibacter ginsenosidimutans TaxID=661481 RepID=A0A5B8UE11_9BACT|nr:cytochrome C oxidase subunit I [Flavisolibacter ginsenosidimutans]QEC54585.1 cytochrome C oxidase subunit I [Flavisolibacter ginsenosidimutans]